MLKKSLLFFLTGDPLYVLGGQPKCLDSDFVDESFADDGYAVIVI